MCLGSSYNGVWDSWYGPSGREGSYNVASVKTSQSGAVLASLGKLPSSAQMLQLREEANVKCLGTEPTNSVNKCQPLREPCLFNIVKDPCEQRNLANVYVLNCSKLNSYLFISLFFQLSSNFKSFTIGIGQMEQNCLTTHQLAFRS